MASSRTLSKTGAYTEQTGLDTITARQQAGGTKIVLAGSKGKPKAGSEPGQFVLNTPAEVGAAIAALTPFLAAPTPPAPPSPPTPSALIADGSADNGWGFWTRQDGTTDKTLGTPAIGIGPSPCLPGHEAFLFTGATAAQATNANGPRAEVGASSGPLAVLQEGDHVFLGDVLYEPVDPNAKLGWSGTHHTIAQIWALPSKGPTLTLDIRDRGNGPQLEVSMDAIGDAKTLIGPADFKPGVAIPIELELFVSADKTKGYVQIWANDQVVLAKYMLALIAAGQVAYVKQGLYGACLGASKIFWHGFKAATARLASKR